MAQATTKQKEIYTKVLKASLRGLFADLPPNADGICLDSIVRTVINQKP